MSKMDSHTPKTLLQQPHAALAKAKDGFMWGPYKQVQTAGYVIQAVLSGQRTTTTMHSHMNMLGLSLDKAELLFAAKVLCMPGFLLPFIRPLGRGRWEYVFYFRTEEPTDEEVSKMFTISEHNERVLRNPHIYQPDAERKMTKWL